MISSEIGYFFRNSDLTNDTHLISEEDIIRLIKINEKDKKQCEQIRKDRLQENNNSNKRINTMYDFFSDVFNDHRLDAFIMTYPHGTVVSQARRNHYYRGENKVHSSSIPSLNRELNKYQGLEREIEKIKAYMRISKFRRFIFKFQHVNNWDKRYGDVLFELVAQHYGLNTHWLDITNDFMTALFFATCYYDRDKNKWKPLTKEVTEINEESKYGVIFHIPNFDNELLLGIQYCSGEKSPSRFNSILPVGFQPFMRCHMQHAYGIEMLSDLPLQEDNKFEKLRFRHDERLSLFVYNKMNQGRLIYPHEGLSWFNDIISDISESNDFLEEDFNYAIGKSGYFNDLKICKEELLNRGIMISSECDIKGLTRQRLKSFDRKYENFSIEKCYGINPTTRMTYI